MSDSDDSDSQPPKKQPKMSKFKGAARYKTSFKKEWTKLDLSSPYSSFILKYYERIAEGGENISGGGGMHVHNNIICYLGQF
jgi:hypothetical protein